MRMSGRIMPGEMQHSREPCAWGSQGDGTMAGNAPQLLGRPRPMAQALILHCCLVHQLPDLRSASHVVIGGASECSAARTQAVSSLA